MPQDQGPTEQIGDHEYMVLMMSPTPSFELLEDVSKMIGPSLGPVLDALWSGARGKKIDRIADLLEADLDGEFFTRAARSLFGSIDKRVMRTVLDAMKDKTYVDGKPLKPIFEEHFRGKLDVMFKWLAFAMKVQWGNSLGALGGFMTARGAEAVNMESQSPSTSTG